MSQINNLLQLYTHRRGGLMWQILWRAFCRPAAKHGEPSGDKKPPTKFATEPPSYMCVHLRSNGKIGDCEKSIQTVMYTTKIAIVSFLGFLEAEITILYSYLGNFNVFISLVMQKYSNYDCWQIQLISGSRFLFQLFAHFVSRTKLRLYVHRQPLFLFDIAWVRHDWTANLSCKK